jgi:post-segregation antitoxin (ccd killing protein)
MARDKTEKQKLTLGIESGIIDKAKAAGINISAITEHLLRSITYDPKGDTRGRC